MTEYVVIVALVAIGTIGIVSLFGDNLRGLVGASADSLAGSGAVAPAGGTTAPGMTEKNLSTFGMQGGDGSSQGGGPGVNSPSMSPK